MKYSLSHPKIKKEIARRYQYLTSSHGNISVVSVRPRQPTSTSIGSANCWALKPETSIKMLIVLLLGDIRCMFNWLAAAILPLQFD